MAIRKRSSSPIVDQLRVRLSGMKSLSENLDLGDGVSVAVIDQLMIQSEAKLTIYNQKLAEADRISNELDTIDAQIKDLSSRVLAKVIGKFGRNSPEYEAVGGTRTSERKKPSKG
ncbi:hypothetical protein [Armatimonas sp.]|uniref:hypothetical protein n=1 Tax=Armatimonas sp. TaxID=1872638 RepID=UPI00374D4210